MAPALLATASMNGAIAESTFNVFFKLNYAKTYDAVLATPLGPGDVALGEIGWAVIRSTLYALGFMVVIVVMGLFKSPWAIFAVPAATLIAFAFAAVGHGRDDVHALVAGLRPDPARGPAAVPVQRHVLPDHAYPPASSCSSSSRRCTRAWTLCRALIRGASTPGSSSTSCTWR